MERARSVVREWTLLLSCRVNRRIEFGMRRCSCGKVAVIAVPGDFVGDGFVEGSKRDADLASLLAWFM